MITMVPHLQGRHVTAEMLCFAGAPLGAILNFLLQLGFREAGSVLRVDRLSAVERTIAADIAQLGLLMPFM
jgi:hypothetical protein